MAFNLNLGALTVALGLDADKFTKGVKDAKSSWGSLKGDLAGLGKGLGAGAALAAGGVALVAKAAADLETELTKAAAVSQGGMANFAAFKAAALDASSGSAASAKQAGESLKYLAMAGFSAKEAMVALPDTIRLASAAGVELGRSADIASDILTGFGLKAADLGHANDVLVLGFTRTNTTLELLAESMKYIGPAAQSTGQSIETMTAAVGLMANVGVKGSQAGTSIRMAMLRMIDPPKKARAALAELGVEVVDQQGKMRDFVDIIGDLERAQSRFGEADFASKISKVVGVEAVSGILGVINQGEGALRSLRDEMVAAKGTTKDLEAQMLQTFGGQWAILTGNIENLMAAIGDAFLPILKELSAEFTMFAVGLQKDQGAADEFSATLNAFIPAFAASIELAGLAVGTFAHLGAVVLEAAGGYQMLYLAAARLAATRDAEAEIVGTASYDAAIQKIADIDAQLEDVAGRAGSYLDTASEAANRFSDATGRIAEIVAGSKIQIQAQTAEVITQEEAWQRAAAALREYGKQWRFVGEGSNFVEAPRWMLAPPPTAGKGAGKDTRTAPKADRDAKRRAAEEAAAAKMRERVAQMQLDAMAQSYELSRIDMEAQAAIEALKLRQLGVVERELEIAKILQGAEAQKHAWLEKQTEEMEKQEKLRQKAISALVAGGSKGGQASGAAGVDVPKKAADDLTEREKKEREKRRALVDKVTPFIELTDSFADMIGDFGVGLKKVLSVGSAALEGFVENGPMGALQGGLMALASSIMDTISKSQVFQDNLSVLGSLFEGMGIGDLVDSFFKSFQPAIGAIVSVFRSFGGANFDKMFEPLGRAMFHAVKGFLNAFLTVRKIFAYADYAITSIIAGISGILNKLVNKMASWIEDVPGLGRPDTSWINDYNRARQKEKEEAGAAIDAINAQQDALADLSYESAQAIYDETLERNKSTESLAALNDELKNAPSGFKLALARFRATDGVGGQGASGGGGQYTTVGQVLVVSNDPAQFLARVSREQYVRTGSSRTIQNQALAASIRGKL
jgi:TP901 family phage tail tape measure protein